MTISRRFRFYFIGLFLGLLLVQVMFKGRGCNMPKDEVRRTLQSMEFEFTEQSRCMVECYDFTDDQLKDFIIKGNFDFDLARQEPCPQYDIEHYVGKDTLDILFAACVGDSLTKVIRVKPLHKDKERNCNCPSE